MKVAIVPAGQWGAALSLPLLENGHDVTWWFYDKHDQEQVIQMGEHPRLPGVTFPIKITSTESLQDAVRGADVVVISCISQVFREVIDLVNVMVSTNTIFINVTKGLERATSLPPSEVINQVNPELLNRFGTMSGPSFAAEVAHRLPTAVTAASHTQEVAKLAQDIFSTERFRVYTSTDLLGVEFGGSLKNVIALAVGVCDGLGLGDNARSALITRGLKEMTAISVACGAKKETLCGLSGMGDLVLTCTSTQSRNYRAGLLLSKGATNEEIVTKLGTVEGIATAHSALQLAKKHNVDANIFEQIVKLIEKTSTVEEAFVQLMNRPLKAE